MRSRAARARTTARRRTHRAAPAHCQRCQLEEYAPPIGSGPWDPMRDPHTHPANHRRAARCSSSSAVEDEPHGQQAEERNALDCHAGAPLLGWCNRQLLRTGDAQRQRMGVAPIHPDVIVATLGPKPNATISRRGRHAGPRRGGGRGGGRGGYDRAWGGQSAAARPEPARGNSPRKEGLDRRDDWGARYLCQEPRSPQGREEQGMVVGDAGALLHPTNNKSAHAQARIRRDTAASVVALFM